MRQVIDSKEFLARVKSDNGKFSGSVTVQGAVILREADTPDEFYEFQNVQFEDALAFRDCGDISAGIKLVNCKAPILSIRGCHVSKYNDYFDGTQGGAGLLLEGCDFELFLFQKNPTFERYLKICKKSTIGSLSIENSNFSEGSITIENSTIANRCDILGVVSPAIGIHESEVQCKVRISDFKGGLSIISSQLVKDTHIDRLQGDLSFNNSTFGDNVYVKNVDVGQFTSYRDHFKGKVDVVTGDSDDSIGWVAGKIGKINLESSFSSQGMIFRGNHSLTFEITCSYTDSMSGDYGFSEFKVKKLILNGTSRNSDLTFKECTFEKILLLDFVNYSVLRFTDCLAQEKNSGFAIQSSWLGKTIFFNVNFKNFNFITVQDSQLYELDVVGNEWFNESQLAHQEELEGGERKERWKRDFYRNLKLSSERQGNKIQETIYRSRELNYYLEELKNLKPWWNWERLALELSQTNDMGLNWVKPLVLLFFITIPFFIFSVSSHSSHLEWMNPVDFCSVHWGNTWNTYAKYGGYFWSMFNPIRNLKLIMEDSNGHLSGWVYMWDCLHRIILAFFIFQIVSAFRKYLK